MNNYDAQSQIRKAYVEIRQFCSKQTERPLFCKLVEFKRYSFASLASLPRLLNFTETIKLKDSFEAILRDKDGNIKEIRKG